MKKCPIMLKRKKDSLEGRATDDDNDDDDDEEAGWQCRNN
jgi:hypothetical protein